MIRFRAPLNQKKKVFIIVKRFRVFVRPWVFNRFAFIIETLSRFGAPLYFQWVLTVFAFIIKRFRVSCAALIGV